MTLTLTRARANLWIGILGLLAIGFSVYLSCLQFGFLSWDDDVNITANPAVLRADWLSIWTKSYYGLYIPFTYSLWAALTWIGGGKPDPVLFHGLNLAVHLINTVLLLLIALRVPRQDRSSLPLAAAVSVAALFMVHPLQVESVCWASGLRDLLSGMFALAAVLLFLRERSKTALLMYVLGLLCKPGLVLLPLALPFLSPKRVRDLSAWFALAAASVVCTVLGQQGLGAGPGGSVAWFLRPLVALDALGFYASKLLWPFNLSVDYGRTPASVLALQSYWAGLPLLVIAALMLWWTETLRFAAFALLLLAPVLGFFPFAFQYVSTVADHYLYLPMAGVALAAGHIAARARVFQGAMWIVILIFAFLAMDRSLVWSDNALFYGDILAKNPRSFQALEALGEEEERAGHLNEAGEYFKQALEISPVNGAAQVGYAKSLVQRGLFADTVLFVEPIVSAADKTYTKANAEYYAQLYYCLGVAQLKLEAPQRAAKAFCEAHRLMPQDQVVEEMLEPLRKAHPEDCP